MTADEILRSFEFYRQATPERRAEYAAAVSTVSLPEGATFYREGDMCPHIALVGRGDIRVFREAPGGREITLYHVRTGEPCLINMLSVFLGRPATASSVAEAATEAAIVPAAAAPRPHRRSPRLRPRPRSYPPPRCGNGWQPTNLSVRICSKRWRRGSRK